MDSSIATGVVVAPRSTAPDAPPPRSVASLSLLHGFELVVDGCPVEVPLTSRRVIAFLVVHRRRLARAFVAGSLWMELDDRRAAAALRTALWRLGPQGAWIVRCEGQELSLDPHVVVDVDVVGRAARDVLEHPDRPVPASVLELLRTGGELLVDWYEDWVVFERERVRQLRLHALEELCGRLSAAGRHALAADVGLAAVASEPLRESAHRMLIGAYLREGNAVEALRQYELCRGLLRRELGLAPSAALEQLVAHLPR